MENRYTKEFGACVAISSSMVCSKPVDGVIYISNGFYILTLTEDEYNAFIRPALPLALEPGFQYNVRNPGFDVQKFFSGFAQAESFPAAQVLTDYKYTDESGKHEYHVCGYYCGEQNAVSVISKRFDAMFSAECERRILNPAANNGTIDTCALAFLHNGKPIGVVLPVKNEQAIQAVRSAVGD